MFDLKEIDFKVVSETPYCLTLCPNEKNTNMNGTIHGGVLFLLCDEIVGRYVTFNKRKGAAANGNINYYRPAFPNKKLFATIQERKCGRRLGVYLIEVKDEKDILIADAQFTVAFIE